MAARGDGQAVVLSGEPGIGKSRVVDALIDSVIRDGARVFAFQCSSYHQNTALYPVQVHLEQSIGRTPEDGASETLVKLEHFFANYPFADVTTASLMAALLGVALPQGTTTAHPSPEQQKLQAHAALMSWMAEEAERQPLLLVFEDLHWADPSTLELVGQIIDQIPTIPLLAVLVARPGFAPPWGSRSYLTPLVLASLNSDQVEAITRATTSGLALPASLIAYIVERTDGVPLFVEEVTKSIVESGAL